LRNSETVAGSHEVVGSVPTSSSRNYKGFAKSAAPFLMEFKFKKNKFRIKFPLRKFI